MEALIYFILWAGLIFVMMRFGCGAHVTGHGSHRGKSEEAAGKEGRAAPPKATDPVCGMTVESATARPSIFEGAAYYFCSNQCREKFEAAPEKYLSQGRSPASAKEHHHA